MTKYISEILLDAIARETRSEKVEALKSTNVLPYRTILRALFDNRIQWFTKEIPFHTNDAGPLGNNISHLYRTTRMLGFLTKQYPADSKRKIRILLQTLESMHPQEAVLFEVIFTKRMNVLKNTFPGLTEKLVLEAFPDLYQDSEIDRLLGFQQPKSINNDESTENLSGVISKN